jgi:hypothetical protein
MFASRWVKRVRGWALVTLIAAGGSGCATTSEVRSPPLTPVVDANLYNLEALRSAFEARGLISNVEGGDVVTRIEDLGVVLLTQPNADREFVRMYVVWARDPSKAFDGTWLAQANETNKAGIVKVYFDDDLDLVAEWYVEVVPGLTTQGLVRVGETFALRARDAAEAFSGILR